MSHLSERERQCILLAGQGLSAKEIARTLGGITDQTVETYLKRGRKKLGATSSVAAARLLSAPGSPHKLDAPLEIVADQPFISEDLIAPDQPARVSAPASGLRDGEGFRFEHDPIRPPRRWHEWLFRRRGERFNDLTTIQTLRSIAILLLLFAASLALILSAMKSWS
jgi:DNA-binding CsgD family transcriptional regulator